MAARAKSSTAGGIWPTEMHRAFVSILAGRSDVAIAAEISASRPVGSPQIDPASIVKLRDAA